MQAVSTLCATGSIVSAASIGLAFGETPSPSSTHVAHFPCPPSTTPRKRHRGLFRSSTSGSIASLASSRPATPLYRLEHSTPSPASKAIQDDHDPRTSPEVKPSGLPHTVHDDRLYTQETVTPVVSGSGLKRATSRLSRRLSSLSVLRPSSSPSDRPQSGRPTTPSDPGYPLFPAPGQDEVDHPPPNKIVKRSLSTQVRTSSGQDAIIQTITLGRPATRHKRAATLSDGSWTRFSTIGPVTPDHAALKPMLPAYFYSVSSQDFDSDAGRRDHKFLSDKHLTTRIAPSPSATPMLCRSDSVAPITLNTDLPTGVADNAFAFGRRPSSSGLVNFFSSPAPSLYSHNHQAREPASAPNLLARFANTKQRNKSSKVKSIDRRVVSAPASTMSGQNNGYGHESSIPQRSLHKQSESLKSHIDDATPDLCNPLPSSHLATAPGSRAQSESPRSVSFSSPLVNRSLHSGSRRSRHSVTFSDIGSSRPGSEVDSKIFSSVDSDEIRSDTAYDSIRTGMTKCSSNYQGPALETLFDSSPRLSSAQTSPLQFDMGTSPPMDTKGQTIFEEDSSTSTPGRTVIQGHRESHEQDRSDHIETAPSAATPALSLGRLPWDAEIDREEVDWPENIGEEDWAVEDETISSSHAPSSQQPNPSLGSVRRKLNFLALEQSSNDGSQRSELLNWSESAGPSDWTVSDDPPVRPQTAYGMKFEEDSRTGPAARRAPGGLHARSKSVPALAELAGPRSSAANKFGTWDIGTKEGIKKEDWDDDFDFDEDQNASTSDEIEAFPSRTEPRKVMIVPDTIRAQQSNVLANIGLLKEWGLRIEELKDLKKLLVPLGIEVEAHAVILEDINAMIALADQEYDNNGLANHQTPSSSPGFGFDDPVQPSPLLVAQDVNAHNDDDEAEHLATTQTPARTSIASDASAAVDQQAILNGPRKDSEAVAVSVIEALQKQRSMKFLGTPDRPAAKKIPFDTTTLKRIVPHVNDLVTSMKQIIGEADGLNRRPKSTIRSAGDALHENFFSPPTVAEREKHDLDEYDDFW